MTDEVKTTKKEEEVNVEKPVTVAKKSSKKRQILKAEAHIRCTYNNTIVTITDVNGATLGWSSSGLLGFKGAKKSTPYAATKVTADVTEKVRKHNIKEIAVFIKGVGGGREAAIRGLSAAGYNISLIKDVTPTPHNGCRRKKPRRV